MWMLNRQPEINLCFEEEWVHILNGGYSPEMLRDLI